VFGFTQEAIPVGVEADGSPVVVSYNASTMHVGLLYNVAVIARSLPPSLDLVYPLVWVLPVLLRLCCAPNHFIRL